MKEPLRICLIMQGGREWIGGTQYIINIILALASLPPETRATFKLFLLSNQTLDLETYNRIQPHLSKIYSQEIDLEQPTIPNRVRWKFLRTVLKESSPQLDNFLRKERFDFIYPFFTQRVRSKPYRSAAWIPDFQHKHLSKFFSQQEIQARDNSFASIAHNAPTVVLSSKAAKADFQKYFPDQASKARVLSFKVEPDQVWYEKDPLSVQQEYALPDRFFLISNQFWQHKNHLVVFQALKFLHAQSIYPVVVCTGQINDYRNSDYAASMMKMLEESGIAEQVHLLGLIPRLDQIQLMRRSLAVIQPSLFEGWSTVVEDARCLAKPTILSDIPVHLEQNPLNSCFFERYSPESLAPVLKEYWDTLSPGPDLKKEAIAKANNHKQVQAFGYRFLEIARGH